MMSTIQRPTVGATVEWLPGDGAREDFGTVTAVVDGGYAVVWTGDVTAKFVPADEVAVTGDVEETFTRA